VPLLGGANGWHSSRRADRHRASEDSPRLLPRAHGELGDAKCAGAGCTRRRLRWPGPRRLAMAGDACHRKGRAASADCEAAAARGLAATARRAFAAGASATGSATGTPVLHAEGAE
jgi:hypothetical protein